MKTITREQSIEIQECGQCCAPIAGTVRWWEERRQSGSVFYCPNGHPRGFNETEADRLKRQVASAEERQRYWQRQYDGAAEREALATRRLSAAKGQMTKLKKRVANGVCPCCNRTFQNLGRHMETKHPDYEGSE